MNTRALAIGAAALGVGALFLGRRSLRWGRAQVPGRKKSAGLLALELGARLLQRKEPLRDFNVYVVGFHPMRDDPEQQMIAHHYCRVVNEDFIQCVVFDGDTRDARLTGVEYIISERLFESLPENEKRKWHPHNYEILSGTLIAPGLPEKAERALMRRLMNSYGKTWHLWMTGGPGHHPDALPTGDACLAWSFNHDGESDESMIGRRDRAVGISSAKRRRLRAELAKLAHPQRGVELLRDHFGGGHPTAPGVRDAEASMPITVTETP